jgi:DHA1 family bicyclomycin/chloramphenicol resistance-like MFS transporter
MKSAPAVPGTRGEFIVLIALLTALVALSIDAMLPALDAIAADFAIAEANQRQFVITSFFFGLTVGTLFYGPVSDATGRKPAIFAGLALYIAGGLLCYWADT